MEFQKDKEEQRPDSEVQLITAPDTESAVRERQPSEKGLQYKLEIKQKLFNDIYKRLTVKSGKINQLMADGASLAEVKDTYKLWMTDYEQFLQAFDELCSYMSDSKKQDFINQSYNEKDVLLKNLKTSVENWFVLREPVIQQLVESDTVQANDSVSQVRSSRRSGVSRHSSARSSVLSARLVEETKQAELLAKSAALKKKQELDLAKYKLQLQQEQLELDIELAVSSAKKKVLDKYENSQVSISNIRNPLVVGSKLYDDVSVTKLPMKPVPSVVDNMPQAKVRHILPHHTVPVSSASGLDPMATPFRPHVKGCVTDNNFNNVTYLDAGDSNQPTHNKPQPMSHYTSTDGMLLSVVRHLSKPPPELKPFNGDPLEYKRFLRQFSSKVVANTDSNSERMSYLEQFTVGEPNAIVSGYSYLDADYGYPAAMNELDQRYGNNDTLAAAFVKRALNWPIIKADNPKALDNYAIFLSECAHAVQSISALKVLEYPDNLRKLLGKLPYYFHDRWRSIIQQNREQSVEIRFLQFVQFVQAESRKANDPVYGKDALRPDVNYTDKNKPKPVANRAKGSFVTNVTTKPESPATTNALPVTKATAFSSPCVFCSNPKHSFEQCGKITELSYQQRIDFLKSKGFCFGCLRLGHNRKGCRNKATCRHCSGRHPSVCHVDGGPLMLTSTKYDSRVTKGIQSGNKDQASVSVTSQAVHSSDLKGIDCTMAILPVAVRMKNGMKVVHTYAFMDPGSTATFCTDGLLRELGGTGKVMEITLDTMGQRCKMKTSAVTGLEICDMQLDNIIQLPRVYTKDRMPVTNAHIPTPNDIKNWSHLNDIKFPDIRAEIGLLVGNNVPDAYAPLEVRTGPSGSPHATRSRLGWILWNVIRGDMEIGSSVKTVTVNRAEIVAIQDHEKLNQLDRRVQEAIRLDFPERLVDDRKEPSQEDRLFTEKVNKSIKFQNGQYCINLPFKTDDVTFPNNEVQARQRLRGLKSKMASSSQYCEDYKAFMQTVIDKGYAEIVPENELSRNDGRVWYIPHHGVYHPRKPNKIRVVFDCSATYQGSCINTALLQGPDLTTSLVSVLLRFRQEKVAVTGDIESMFYRVNIPKEDSDCLRFLWWPSGNIHNDPQTYRMTVHLFRAISSPSCANIALKRTADDNSHKFDPKVTDTVKRQFYVEDCLTSEESRQKASKLVQDVSEMCELGGFRLTKWMSSSREVIESVPEDRRAKGVQHLDLDCEHLPNERVLGIYWITEDDKLGFSIQPRDQPYTRRGILSVVSSVFDPLGLAAPFVLVGKLILQDCSRKHIGWDEAVTGDNAKDWQKWLDELPLLSTIKIDRCYKADTLDKITSYQLHVFADASEKAYGVAVYLKLTDQLMSTHVALLMGKARVAPLKKISIPRLELTAACTAVRLSRVIVRELDYHIERITFWTDSMAVLRYFNNQSTRFHTFVANRVAVIRDGSDVQQWKFVPSKLNVADLASRGCHLDKFLENQAWFNGPGFLKQPETEWPQQSAYQSCLPEDDPEVKTAVAATSPGESTSVIGDLISRCSDWLRLRSILGWVLVAVDRFKGMMSGKKNTTKANASARDVKQQLMTTYLPEATHKRAEEMLVKHVQREYFSGEIDMLTNQEKTASRRGLPKSSPLRRLDPFIADGLLRVGGRLNKADIPFNARHPMILPRCGLSALYLEYVHRKVGHLGRNSILNTARQEYWVIGAPASIRKLVNRCVTCRRYQARVGEQKMSDLPLDRLQSHQPPFSSVGVDYFGPIEVKRGRNILKRYGVIFTCLATRAVHLEMASSLDTDACICALRRFLARRGPVKTIRSDNGTNLVGSERELREEILGWNQANIHNYLQQRSINWIFNPPLASHHGGIWERIIRIVRKVLYSLLRQQSRHLDDELLRTLFCEVESILNSRPITEVSQDYRDLDALTPNHLLLGRCGETLPPGIFDKNDNFANRRWRQVQYLADIFWRRWTLEYLPLLQERQRWHQPRRNLQKGDLVLVVDITPRKSWCLGRILEATKDRHGCVRSATVKTKSTTLVRPIDKLCLLLEADIESS